MLKQEEIVKRPEYWLETIQNEIYRQVSTYLKENKMTQTQLAMQFGVSKGYISQIMKGEFNYTLKTLIEISLAVGKAPVIAFKPLGEINQTEQGDSGSISKSFINKVADPNKDYPSQKE
jgi:transcriptional regulator with XRE-family HTH domain